jgi:heptosyltransferase-2
VEFSNILIRATNWVGDAVMCLPALRAIRGRFPQARIAILAKPAVADLYARESCVDEVIRYNIKPGRMARELRVRGFDCAILLQNAFEAAWIAWRAGIPNRIGYSRDGRGWLLTCAVPVPRRGEIPRHERFYYLELLRRTGMIERLPESPMIRLEHPATAATRGASIALFGSASERPACEQIAQLLDGHRVTNHAGQTTLGQFIDLAARCELFLTNDSGAMHIASALGVPTIAVFGATDDDATGPTGPRAHVVRQPVECSPCLLRECPIDHRCMSRVSADRVVKEALALLVD